MAAKLTDVRNALEKIIVGAKDGRSMPNAEIIKAFRKANDTLIAETTTALVDATLVKLISDVGNRKRSFGQSGPDLFGTYDGIRRMTVVRTLTEDGHVSLKRMRTEDLTVGEFKTSVAQGNQKQQSAPKSDKKSEALRDDFVTNGISDDVKVKDGIAILEKQRAAKKA